MVTVVISEWLMCFGMGFSTWEGPKQIWSLFVLWREGYKERRLQGRSEIKDITFINGVGYSRRPFSYNHQWMIPWTRKLMTWIVTETVTLDQSCNSVTYNVHLRICPFKFDYFLWSVWANVCPALGAFGSCLFCHLEGMMDLCMKPCRVRAVSSWCHASNIAWDRLSCCKCLMKLLTMQELFHAFLVWGMCSCLSWECLSCAPGDTGPWFSSANLALPSAVSLGQASSLILLLWSF